MKYCTISFEFLSGKIVLTERIGKLDAIGGFSNDDLITKELNDDLNLNVTIDDEEGVTIEQSVYHIENDETKKAFHAILTSNLEWDTVRQLRDFLNMILQWQQDLPYPTATKDQE
jgi:hypothetical protein